MRSSARSRRRLPVGPPLFPDDMVTDRSQQFIAQEIVREQLYHQLGKELPYACAVVIENWEDRGGEVAIGAVIVVERESQKPIVVGRGGQRVSELGIAARTALERGARQARAPDAVRAGASRSGASDTRELARSSATAGGAADARPAARARRPAERRQVDAVQSPGRWPARARARYAAASRATVATAKSTTSVACCASSIPAGSTPRRRARSSALASIARRCARSTKPMRSCWWSTAAPGCRRWITRSPSSCARPASRCSSRSTSSITQMSTTCRTSFRARLGEPWPVSAAHGRGIDALLEAIVEAVDAPREAPDGDESAAADVAELPEAEEAGDTEASSHRASEPAGPLRVDLRRPAERRQVVAHQPLARRGAIARASRGRDDDRPGRHAVLRRAAATTCSSIRQGSAARRRSTPTSRSSR